MCTPRRRCDPEHSRQTKAPVFSVPGGAPGGGAIRLAHVGFRSGQSAQTWFSGKAIRAFSRFFIAFWSDIARIPYLSVRRSTSRSSLLKVKVEEESFKEVCCHFDDCCFPPATCLLGRQLTQATKRSPKTRASVDGRVI